MTEDITLTRTIAISAIYEIALVIKKIAWHGLEEQTSFNYLIEPVLQKENINQQTINIYGSVNNIHQGIQSFLDSLQTNNIDREVNRYVFSLIYLANKLNSNPNMLAYINRELDHIRTLTGIDETETDNDNFYELNDAHILRLLATIYQNSISKLGSRILINGKPGHLTQQETTNAIRSLLLSGIRSAILWHRNGGSRLKLLFHRKTYVNCAIELLAHND